MIDVLLLVLAVLGAWAGAAVVLALLAGGAIRVREERDAPAPAAPASVPRLGA